MVIDTALAVLAADAGSGIIGNAAYDGVKKALAFVGGLVQPVPLEVKQALDQLPDDALPSSVVAALQAVMGAGGNVLVSAGNDGGGSVTVTAPS